MHKEERDTITEVLQLVVTVDANIEDCLDHDEWIQEIMYAINYQATEKNPEQAREKGFNIAARIRPLPKPCEPEFADICCAECTVVDEPELCEHQCNPLRDNDVSWSQPSICAFYEDGKCRCDNDNTKGAERRVRV